MPTMPSVVPHRFRHCRHFFHKFHSILPQHIILIPSATSSYKNKNYTISTASWPPFWPQSNLSSLNCLNPPPVVPLSPKHLFYPFHEPCRQTREPCSLVVAASVHIRRAPRFRFATSLSRAFAQKKKHRPHGSYVHKTDTSECASRGSNHGHPD